MTELLHIHSYTSPQLMVNARSIIRQYILLQEGFADA